MSKQNLNCRSHRIGGQLTRRLQNKAGTVHCKTYNYLYSYVHMSAQYWSLAPDQEDKEIYHDVAEEEGETHDVTHHSPHSVAAMSEYQEKWVVGEEEEDPPHLEGKAGEVAVYCLVVNEMEIRCENHVQPLVSHTQHIVGSHHTKAFLLDLVYFHM